MYKDYKLICLNSAPRSGSSWLQTVIEAHPNIKTVYQPMFSYGYNYLVKDSFNSTDLNIYINKLVKDKTDRFINRCSEYHVDGNNIIPKFKKEEIRSLLMKHVRFHHYLETFLSMKYDVKIIALIRNPCGAINSLISNPREYPPEYIGTNHWITGGYKDKEKDQYFGYDGWKRSTDIFLDLKKKYPKNVMIVKYEEIVKDAGILFDLFNFLEYRVTKSVLEFYNDSHNPNKTNDSHTGVYKDTNVTDKWKDELDPSIQKYIIDDIKGTKYEQFLI